MKKTENYKHFREQMQNFHCEYESPDSTNYTFRDMMCCWDRAYDIGSIVAMILSLIVGIGLGMAIGIRIIH